MILLFNIAAYHALVLASTNHELSHDRVISSSSITDSITIHHTFQNENVGFEIPAILLWNCGHFVWMEI